MLLPSLLLFAVTLPSTLAKSRCEEKLEQCETRGLKRPVCGSDDKTYPSRCQLLKAKCAGKTDLVVVWRGPCSERPSCWEDDRSEGKLGFKCLSDGSYAPVQCQDGTGYCWCVTASGVPIPNSTVWNQKPKCHRGKLKKMKKVRPHRRRKGRVCGKVDRAKFINNLVRKFNRDLCLHEEGIEKHCKYDGDSYKKGVEWKFDTLDTNGDKNLTSNEYQEFQKLVRKAVSPQRCSRSFISMCDKDKDMVITHEEWSACLVKSPITRKNRARKKKPSPEGDFGGELIGPPGLQDGVPLLHGSITPLEEGESPPERKEEHEGSDCLTDRKNVLGEQTDFNYELFLPECTPDGRYQKVQCYKSTGYCWCVNEDTGKPIPGTSRKDHNPNCDALQLPLRPMKGCPEHKKQLFLKELKDFFKKQSKNTTDANGSQEEFAVSTFQVIDTNKNKFIEKKEMKPLRTLLLSFSQPVKRCGKKFPKYCDVNHDRKISLTEWVNCMDSERSSVGMTVSPSPQRKGPNPLESILKSDDDD